VKNTIVMTAAIFSLLGCAQKKPIQQPPQGVQAQSVAYKANSAAGLRFSAVVMPDMEVPLSFRVPGYVVSLKQVRGEDGRMRDIAEGDHVSRGTMLVQIRTTEYQEKVHQASTELRGSTRPRVSRSPSSTQPKHSTMRRKPKFVLPALKPARHKSLCGILH
jgi:multidrug efflux pump subunit AcrA (membrane-fusion protein)